MPSAMNTKKSKRRKGVKRGFRTKTETKDGEAEVFVLPPDLLQKLGINLENFETTQAFPTQISSATDNLGLTDTPVGSFTNEAPEVAPKFSVEKEIRNDATILITADLMKKSLLLSPTFVSAGNIDPGELEISSEPDKKSALSNTVAIGGSNSMPGQNTDYDIFTKKDNTHIILDSYSNRHGNNDRQKNLNIDQSEMIPILLNANELDQKHQQGTLHSDSETTLSVDIETAALNIMPEQENVNENLPQIYKVPVTMEPQLSSLEITEGQNVLNKCSEKLEIPSEIQPNHMDIGTTLSNNNDTTTPNIIPKQFVDNEHRPQSDNLSVILDQQTNNQVTSYQTNNQRNNSNHLERTSTHDSDLILLSNHESNEITIRNFGMTNLSDEPANARSPDEAYLSDCSNSNSGSLNATETLSENQLHSFDFEITKKCQNKIKIISEEIISPSKLKDLQVMLSPKKSDFIPVSMNCILRSNKFSDHIQCGIDTVANIKNADVPLYPSGNNSEKLNRHKYLDNVVLYEEEGNVLSTVQNKISAQVRDIRIGTNFDVQIKDMTQHSDQDLGTKGIKPEIPANNFGDIGLIVIDMEMVENQEIIDNFVDEIASVDDSKILKQIEESEQNFNHNIELVKLNCECTQSERLSLEMEDKQNEMHNSNTSTSLLSNNFMNGLDPKTMEKKKIVDDLNEWQVSQALQTSTDFNVFFQNKSEDSLHNCPTMFITVEPLEVGRIKSENEYFKTKLNAIESNDIASISQVIPRTECKDKLKTELGILDCNILIGTDLEHIQSNNSTLDETKITEDKVTVNSNTDNDFDIDSIGMISTAIDSQNDDKILGSYTKDCGADEEPVKTNNHCSFEESDLYTSVKFKAKFIDTPMDQLKHASKELNYNDTTHIGDVNSPHDKVNEIAVYLSQFAKKYPRTVKLGRKSDRKSDIPVKRSKQNPLTSKIYIQGVEKPGGPEESHEDYKVNKVLKTYVRANKPFKMPISLPMTATTQKELQMLSVDNHKQEENNIVLAKASRHLEFCLCGDFGRLDFYDSDYPYEHIHFWEHTVINCDCESIFGIYDDNNSGVYGDISTIEILDSPEDQEQNLDIPVDSICWRSCKNNKQNKTSNIERDQTPQTIEVEGASNKSEAGVVSTKVIESFCIVEPDRKLQQTDFVATTSSATVTNQSNKLHASMLNTTDTSTDTNATNVENNTVDKSKILLSDQNTTRDTSGDTLFKKVHKSKDIDSLKSVHKRTAVAEGNKPADPISMEEGNDDVEEMKGQKRKKSLKHEKVYKDVIDEPKNKKSVKCGVCKNVFSEAQWQNHVSTEHCCIAWRFGSSFDFEEPSLLKNLQEKLKNMSSLTCTFCSAALRHPKKYLTHVKKCFLNLEDSQNNSESIEMGDNAANKTIVDEIMDGQLQPHEKSVSCDEDVSKCGVCKEIVTTTDWVEHITHKHEYLAWRNGETPLNLDDDEDVRQHLANVVKETKELKCSKCGLARKYPKSYMQHVRNCTGRTETPEECQNPSKSEDLKIKTNHLKKTAVVTCGVCNESMSGSGWMQHIQVHAYLAWRVGEPPLHTDDEESVKTHLINISKENGGLVCNKCGCIRKYVKPYMQHLNSCKGPKIPEPDKSIFINPLLNNSINEQDKATESSDVERGMGTSDGSGSSSMSKCGVCHKEVSSVKWIQHISRAHFYMAWKEGESLNVNDEEEVYDHLYKIIRKAGYLVCSKCGTVRKYVKSFLQHAETCDKVVKAEYDINEGQETDGKLVCAVCSEQVDAKKWKKHKMEKHYNVAWTVGSIPVDIKNPNVIDTLIKEYKEKYKKLVCNVCHATRVSRVGFYAHVIACGKTEEEVDAHKNLCKICNKKYLCIYHSQHMTWHTQQEYAREKKIKAEEEERELANTAGVVKQEVVTGRRRAALKARNIMENFKNERFSYECPTCKFGSDSKDELDGHVCKNNADEDFSDSGESACIDQSSEDESDDSIDGASDASHDELEQTLKKSKHKTYSSHSLLRRFPFAPKNIGQFLTKIGAEFHQHHFTRESLFPELRVSECTALAADQLAAYLPPLLESCKVQFCEATWTTYKRFEVHEKKCIGGGNDLYSVSCQCMFTGGCIGSVSWAPPGPDRGNRGGNVLAVACHRGADVTRLPADRTAAHPGLIQLWDFGHFDQPAEMVFGLAHDDGTVWAMDWCPSGARDVFPEDPVEGNVLRLGLLAVAFSSGRVCIFSVPYPSTLVKPEQVIWKLKPVAELRLAMNPDRKTYQATAISWSMQNPNECILVGYADGTTAYFDLNTKSPFLKTVENNIVIVYPYHDERVHNTCVTGVGLYPCAGGAGGAASSSSPTGCALAARAGVRAARQAASLAAGGARFQPLWPSAALVGDEGNMSSSVNEIEWFGGGRRMGGGSAGAGCAHCGRLALAALPLLRVRYPHPADNNARRQVLGILQMTPLTNKMQKLENDELQTKLEPNTYEDAIKKYGIELRMDKHSISKTAKKSRDQYPERCPQRFPLGDVNSLAFCPEAKYHRKLAVATHSGILFLLHV